jgi:hypothetical protein
VFGEEPFPLPFRPQISHELAWDRSRYSVSRGRLQKARPMARRLGYISYPEFYIRFEFLPRSKHIASVKCSVWRQSFILRSYKVLMLNLVKCALDFKGLTLPLSEE